MSTGHLLALAMLIAVHLFTIACVIGALVWQIAESGNLEIREIKNLNIIVYITILFKGPVGFFLFLKKIDEIESAQYPVCTVVTEGWD